jgi:DNA primase
MALMRERLDLTKVDVEEFLEGLRIRNLQRADSEYWRFSCPFAGHSHGDETPSAQMRDDNTAFHCFGCKRSGNAITFLSEYEGVAFLEARRWIREMWGGGFVEPLHGAANEWIEAREAAGFFFGCPSPDASPQVILPEETLQRFDVDWADAFCEWSETHHDQVGVDYTPLGYMFSRGFEPETLMDWEIGYDDQGERFTIPVRDEEGSLVGFKGRAWDPDRHPKYLALGDKPDRPGRYGFPTFEKSLVVFGLPKAHSARRLIICEGELNVLAMHQKGFPNTVAIAGSSLSGAQARLIREHCDEALIFFDSLRDDGSEDEAGMDATWGYLDERKRYHPGAVDALEPHMRVLVAPEHVGDPADMTADQIQECLDGARGSVSSRPSMRAHVRD